MVKTSSLGCFHSAKVAMGSVLIGGILSSALVNLRTTLPQDFLRSFISMSLFSTLFCAPGSILLSLWLHSSLVSRGADWTVRQMMKAGITGGIKIAFLNIPAYFVISLMAELDDRFFIARAILLFAVIGAACGFWVAMQAWRALHPADNFPRFSFGTLMWMAVLFGFVLLVFQPRKWS